MISPIGKVTAIMAAAVLAADATAGGFGDSDQVGPGRGSKGITRGRSPVEQNEFTTSKSKSEALKRLLRK